MDDYSLESYTDIIEDNEIIMESLVYDVDIALEGQHVDAYNLWKTEGKVIKRKFKEAGRCIGFLKGKNKDPEMAIKLYTEVIKMCVELKQKVKDVPKEKDPLLKRFLTDIKSIFIKDSELTGAYMVGNTLVTQHTHYDDRYSRTSPNMVQRSIQEALNLLIKQSKDGINRANQIKNKAK